MKDWILLVEGIIEKGKKYVTGNQTAPKGVTMHTGKRGGRYYLTEDKHMKLNNQHHELVRSVGVKRDQWDELRDQFQKQGAKSVEFIPKPDYGKREGDDTPLYNMYVNWGEKTQQKIEEKLKKDKEKYGKKVKVSEDGEIWEGIKNNIDEQGRYRYDLGYRLHTTFGKETKDPKKAAETLANILETKGREVKIIDDGSKYAVSVKHYQPVEEKKLNNMLSNDSNMTKEPEPKEQKPGKGAKEGLIELGGKHWQSGDKSKERVYLSNALLEKLIGLKTDRYGTGNISSASLQGEKISNSRAREIISGFGQNPYYDLREKKLEMGTEFYDTVLKQIQDMGVSDADVKNLDDQFRQTVKNDMTDDDYSKYKSGNSMHVFYNDLTKDQKQICVDTNINFDLVGRLVSNGKLISKDKFNTILRNKNTPELTPEPHPVVKMAEAVGDVPKKGEEISFEDEKKKGTISFVEVNKKHGEYLPEFELSLEKPVQHKVKFNPAFLRDSGIEFQYSTGLPEKFGAKKGQGILINLPKETLDKIRTSSDSVLKEYNDRMSREAMATEVPSWSWNEGIDTANLYISPEISYDIAFRPDLKGIIDDFKTYSNIDMRVALQKKSTSYKSNPEYLHDDRFRVSNKDLLDVYNQYIKPRKEAKTARKEASAKERKLKEDAAFKVATETNQPQIIETYPVECNDRNEECDMDNIVVYAMPDGTKKKTRHHTW